MLWISFSTSDFFLKSKYIFSWENQQKKIHVYTHVHQISNESLVDHLGQLRLSVAMRPRSPRKKLICIFHQKTFTPYR